MELITRAQMVALSDGTFIDNDQGLIDPSAQRVFNNKSFDFMIGLVATFVIDSNEALAAWANNTEGNDYTNVLIRVGEWTSDVEVNLTTSGTKVVVGMPGSLLKFTSRYGLKYDVIPASSEYWIHGVNANIGGGSFNTDSSLGSATDVYNIAGGFYNCTNLTDCFCSSTGTVATDTSDESTVSISLGFVNCENLSGCTSAGTGNGGHSLSTVIPSIAAGFAYCENLSNCKGTGTEALIAAGFAYCENLSNCKGTGTEALIAAGFIYCENSSNCKGTGTILNASGGSGYGFYECTNLSNCKGDGNSASYYANGFNHCENLVHCTGTSTITGGTQYSNGFANCKRLTSCVGTGTSTITAYNTQGYGFYNCHIMSFCKPGGTSKTATYYNCYMNASSMTGPVANTADGGWNVS